MASTLSRMQRGSIALAVAAAALSLSASAGDAAKGADVFKRICSSCHTIEKGAGNGALGPNLFAVSGRSAGATASFHYSPSLKASGVVWTDDKLKAWVQNPQKLVPGTRMVLIHTPTAEQADDVVAYLDTKK